MTEAQAHAVYDVLVTHAGAEEEGREDFVFHLAGDRPPDEYRFQGWLGMGGKFRRGPVEGRERWLVDCYPEDETADRAHAIGVTNARLAAIKGQADALAAALKENS